MNINVLEFRAIFRALDLISELPQAVLVFSDNSATVSAVNHLGSRAHELQGAARQEFPRLRNRGVYLRARHISGHLNVAADALSRDTPIPTEWSLQQREFRDSKKRTVTR